MRYGLLLVALQCVGCGERPMEPREPTPGVPHFTIATYNILDEASKDPNTVSAIGELNADVLCLQEVTPEWERILRARYRDRYPHMLFYPSGSAGLGFLSRYPLEDHAFVPGPNGWHPAWHVLVETPAGWLQVLNVHLRAPEGKGVENLQSIAALSADHRSSMTMFQSHGRPGMPTVVLGDFNESTDGAAVQLLESQGFRNALPLFYPGQYTWKKPSLGGQFTQTIDHVMFDKSMQPLHAYVKNIGGSDHLPVIAHLEASYSWQ